MSDWMRTRAMSQIGESAVETWRRGDTNYEVHLQLGKKTDLLTLKKSVVANLRTKQAEFHSTRSELYGRDDLELVKQCMVCGAPSSTAMPRLVVYGAEYVQCQSCTHVFVIRRPKPSAISKFYLSDTNYAATYTDREAAESRLNAIAVPWLEWMTKQFERCFGRRPQRVLDVGSGAGHFVEACRRAGLHADGVELSESSRGFARDVWGFELDGRDFTEVAEEYQGADVVTFWGLLEHTPNPRELLDCARQLVGESGEGFIVAKLPRWDSLGSAAQAVSPDTVLRHLDPMGHIMAFTDASAAELFHRARLSPAAAWYYGMDVYELLTQLSNVAGSYDSLTRTGPEQIEVQQSVDEARFSDGLVLGGVVQRAARSN